MSTNTQDVPTITITHVPANRLPNGAQGRIFHAWLGTHHTKGVSPRQAVARMSKRLDFGGDVNVKFEQPITTKAYVALACAFA